MHSPLWHLHGTAERVKVGCWNVGLVGSSSCSSSTFIACSAPDLLQAWAGGSDPSREWCHALNLSLASEALAELEIPHISLAPALFWPDTDPAQNSRRDGGECGVWGGILGWCWIPPAGAGLAAQTHLLCDFGLMTDSFVILGTMGALLPRALGTDEVQGGDSAAEERFYFFKSSSPSPGLLHTSQMLRLLLFSGIFHVHFILRGAPWEALSWEELMLKLVLLLKVREAFCSRPEIRENQQWIKADRWEEIISHSPHL